MGMFTVPFVVGDISMDAYINKMAVVTASAETVSPE